jgi:hypothetical protein
VVLDGVEWWLTLWAERRPMRRTATPREVQHVSGLFSL